MNFNFELVLFYAVLISGIIALFDILFLEKKRKQQIHGQFDSNKMPFIIDYARSFFPVLLLVFFLRSFLFEPFRIPSGSLEPTLLIGDFILVNKFDYGIRLPVIHKKIFKVDDPKRGDIIVFRWPPDESYDFIKRIIGVPGDHIKYIDKVLYINGKKVDYGLPIPAQSIDESGSMQSVVDVTENLPGVTHQIFQNPHQSSHDFNDIVVPVGMYYVMGDNRDDSADSRFWGLVPDKNIVGKAIVSWMSWDNNNPKYLHKIRWDRIFKIIH